jgi:hypothetical protein
MALIVRSCTGCIIIIIIIIHMNLPYLQKPCNVKFSTFLLSHSVTWSCLVTNGPNQSVFKLTGADRKKNKTNKKSTQSVKLVTLGGICLVAYGQNIKNHHLHYNIPPHILKTLQCNVFDIFIKSRCHLVTWSCLVTNGPTRSVLELTGTDTRNNTTTNNNKKHTISQVGHTCWNSFGCIWSKHQKSSSSSQYTTPLSRKPCNVMFSTFLSSHGLTWPLGPVR